MDAHIKLERNVLAIEQGDTVHVMVEIEAPVPAQDTRRPIDVVAVIDRSGSMHGEPLDAAKTAVERLLRMLGPDDRMAVVAYDDDVRLVLGLTRHATPQALHSVRSIDSGGSTNLAGGWLKAYEVLMADGRSEAVRKVLLLTDGRANVGMTEPTALAGLCANAHENGIGTSTIGLGEHYDEELLAAMADGGHGSDHFVASVEDLPGVFADEFADLGAVVAHNVSLEIRPADEVALVEIYGDRPPVEVEHGVQVSLGDAYGGERRRLVFALAVPGLADLGSSTVCEVVLRYTTVDQVAALHTVTMPVVVNVVEGGPGSADPEVTEEVLLLRAAKARKDARERLLEGDTAEAARLLESTARELRNFLPRAPDATRVRLDADALTQQARDLTAESLPFVSKLLYTQSRTQARGRYKRRPDA